MQGYLHSIESFSALDGPGVRSVVFLQGCPLRCVYCHNPESWELKDGTLTDSSEVLARAAKNSNYIASNGGVTISGGEPTFQIDFLGALLKGFKKLGLHTALDTSGYVCLEPIKKILDDTDLFIVDMKHLDPAACQALTGRTNSRAFALLRFLAQNHKDVWIRSVLLPGLTDSEDYIRRLCSTVKKLGNVKRLEILPCHNLADGKYQALGIPNRNPCRAGYDAKTLQTIGEKYDRYYGEKVII
jgi:pyruvate formate lyase activating enzyme